ncbi:MAG: VCBS repeat-containing protein [Bacteroidetes bacterium]|nr:VCBS repeat-containing protein [Bacteroidota bacterium]
MNFFIKIFLLIFISNLSFFSNLFAQTFTEIDAGLTGVDNSSVAWGDYDNDGDLDILLTGSGQSKIYKNDLPDSVYFTEQTLIELTGVSESSVSWGDYDNDGDLDILLTGYGTNCELISKIYRNTLPDSVGFLEQTNIFLLGVKYSSVAWGDYDNDGDLDILLTGYDTNYGSISKIYRNNYPTNTFTETQILLPGVYVGSVTWGDFDNDSDLDILLSGYAGGINISNIYRNDLSTSGVFAEISLPGAGVQGSSVAWGDYDNDGDLDILISGQGISKSKIYKNTLPDSVGFVEQTDIALPGVKYCSVAWGDYDNDGNLDILITGNREFDTNYDPISKIYRNNYPLNSFTEQTDIPLIGVGYGSSAYGDFDNDGDLDILLTGREISNNSVSLVYCNKTKTTNTVPVAPDNISYSILSGKKVQFSWNSSSDDHTPTKTLTYNISLGTTLGDNDIISAEALDVDGKLLKPSLGNNGFDTSYTMELLPGTYYFAVQSIDQSYKASAFSTKEIVIDQVQASRLNGTATQDLTMLLKWVRGNSSRCIVFMKCLSSIDTAKPVVNTKYVGVDIFGDGDMIGNTEWYCIYNGTSKSVEVRGLKTGVDYIVQVMEYTENGTSIVYNNSIESNLGSFSLLPFSEQTGNSLANVCCSSLAWGDYDNDGDLDILLTGSSGIGEISKIYCNNGDNSFSEQIGIPLKGVVYGSSVWGDYDNDGDLDILITGDVYEYEMVSKIYRNSLPDSIGFIEQTSISLIGVAQSSVAWGDYDSDGDLDILLAGEIDDDHNVITKIYKNNAPDSFGFTEQTGISLEGVMYGSLAWGDYDNDGDLDILLTGYTNYDLITKIYRNNYPTNLFTETQISLPGVSRGSVAWGDYDNDGDLDILLTGSDTNYDLISKIYRNNYPTNSFTESQISLSGVSGGSVAWVDYDNDGDLDILLTGSTSSGRISKIYNNNYPTNSFTETQISLRGVSGGSVAWGDYDNDGDLDILLTGYSSSGTVSKIYRNNVVMKSGIYANAKAAKPTGLKSENTQKGVKLSWIGPSNDETLQSTLSYNINIGTNKDSLLLKAQYSCDTIRKPERGNCGVNNFYYPNCPSINSFYYYRVQAVDQGFLGGEWSVVDSFQVNNLQAFFSATTECFGDSTVFKDASLVTGTEIKEWKWDFGDDSTSTKQNPKHLFLEVGWHKVSLEITDTAHTAHSQSDTNYVYVKHRPDAAFSAPNVCDNKSITFENNTICDTTNISWNWEIDGETFSSHKIPSPLKNKEVGTYEIKLIATAENGCYDSKIDTVQVAEIPNVGLSISDDLDFCPGDSVIIYVTDSTILNYAYQWLKGESYLPDEDSYMLKATDEGEYSVIIENTIASCVDTSSVKNVIVYPKPSAQAILVEEDDTISCKNQPVILYVDLSLGYHYQWYSDDGAVGTDTSKYKVTNSGHYYVKIINENKCENFSAKIKTVVINPLPDKPSISQSGDACDSIKLSVPDSSLFEYQWLKDGAGIEYATDTSYYVTEVGTANYSLNLTNKETGCEKESDNISVTIKPKPDSPEINAKDDTVFCVGNSVELYANPVEGLTYEWKLDGGAIGSDTSSLTAYYEGNYSLEVTNINNCTASSQNQIQVSHYDNPPNLEIKIEGSTEFCIGDSVLLSFDQVEGCTSKWLLYDEPIAYDENQIYAKQEGDYKLELTNTNGCTSFSSNTVEVKVNSRPETPVITYNGTLDICEGDELILSINEQTGCTYQWYNDIALINNETVNYKVTEAGIYYVKVNTDYNCINQSQTKVVTVSKTPEIQDIETDGNTLVCPGEPVLMTVNNNSDYTYQWKLDGLDIDNANTHKFLAIEKGKYSVDIYNNNCGITTPTQELKYKPSLSKPYILTKGSTVWILACSNDTAFDYKWFYNNELLDGANECLYTANQNLGKYYVSINDGGECYVASDVISIPEGTTGIEEINTFGEIKIYPNPTPGSFTIYMDNEIMGELHIRIINTTGKTLFNIKLNKDTRTLSTQMDLSGQGAGIYYVEFRFERDKTVRKLIVE